MNELVDIDVFEEKKSQRVQLEFFFQRQHLQVERNVANIDKCEIAENCLILQKLRKTFPITTFQLKNLQELKLDVDEVLENLREKIKVEERFY